MRIWTRSCLLGLATLVSLSCSQRAADSSHSTADALRFTSIVAGNLFTCGLDGERVLWCWGSNEFGQLGVGDREDRQQPVRVPLPTPSVRVNTGEAKVCAVDAEATLRCWGDNVGRSLADSTVELRSTPAVLPVGRVRQIAAGSRFTCATDEGDRASCWGGDHSGELGDGGDTTVTRIERAPVATPIAFDTLVAGRVHACGLTIDGEAWCWGADGLTGDGSREKRTQPTRVAGGHRFRSLTAGSGVTCGVTRDEAAWCWGLGSDGQLGYGEGLQNEFVPVLVAGRHRFRQLAAGYHRVCGLDLDGLAWCWGSNFNGALGDTGRVSSPIPVRVRGDRRYVAIASGDSHACALDREGKAWCWGQNRTGSGGGAIGDGTLEDRSFPVAVVAPRSRSATDTTTASAARN